MKTVKSLVIIRISVLLIPILIFSINCAQKENGHGVEGENAHQEADENTHGEEGEESGKRYSISDTCDEIRAGVQLHLTYDESSSAFIGSIKNVSNEPASRVRVEVHLSNKVELGPTKPVDLEPGKQANVKLSVEDQFLTWWTAHAEVGGSELEHGEEGEHAHEEEGEHIRREESEESEKITQ